MHSPWKIVNPRSELVIIIEKKKKKSAYMDLPGEVVLVSSNSKYALWQLNKTIQTVLHS